MTSFAYFFTLVASVLLFGQVNCQSLPINPICHRSETTNIAALDRCANTTIASIRAVLNASDDFDEACENLDLSQAADDDLDIPFLRFQVCGNFGGWGQFYGNTDNAITIMALVKVALEVANEDNTDPALRFICRGLDLSLIRKFQLSADTIYDLACGGLYIPEPSSSISSTAVPSTTVQSSSTTVVSSYSLTTPPMYSTITSLSGYSSTPCTTSSSYSSSIAVYRRQDNGTNYVDEWIKSLKSAIWALNLIELDEDDDTCDVDDFWVDEWDSLGYDGDYVEGFV
jgi:hypothetical protein